MTLRTLRRGALWGVALWALLFVAALEGLVWLTE
jgi:hypothetical protein